MRIPSHATIAAYGALFVALSGTSYGATQSLQPSTYYVKTRVDLTSQNPSPIVRAACRSGDRLIQGGFASQGVIVTANGPIGTEWQVQAHADPATTSSSNTARTAVAPPHDTGPVVIAYVQCQS